ncbi:H-2 class I histocompatibility antigen, Q8 alpha chain-like [Apodemus sylvaticus]|uniref:H-2 class I histocompatibility antigen, Q8 alpha chain-like n=1 Tax=Apodemus sylvaticus TaxID=10129 RepID=UPI002243214C|nr:H-2 class I histocompatibility antigen, Q8 alpha chain-like [Apodemus sylvaticus]
MVWVLKAAVLCAILLKLDACLSWTPTPLGSHSLRYCSTATSWPSPREPRIIVVGNVDDTECVRLDSDDPKTHRVDLCALEQAGREYWEQQIYIVRNQAQLSERKLMTLVRLYKSMNDSHTLQWLQGCDVGSDGRLLHWYDQFAYDGVDRPTLNQDLSSWTAGTSTVAQISQHQSESYLKGHCSELLQKSLEKGKERLLRPDPPKAHVTCHPGPKGYVTLRCWALGFYPADITLTWKLDGEDLTQDMEFVETRPAGDGTFQKWAAVAVPLGKEQKYTCHVEHEGLSEPLTRRWEPAWYKDPTFWIVASIIILVIVCVFLLVFCICKKKNAGRRERRDTQEADRDSPQDSRTGVDDEEMEAFCRTENEESHSGHLLGTHTQLCLLTHCPCGLACNIF